MFQRNHLILLVLVAVLLILIVFTPMYGWRLRGLLNPVITSNDDVQQLKAQNELLEAELASLQVIQNQLPEVSSNTLRAIVYSHYPFNFRNAMLINAGSNMGVAQGRAVLFRGMVIGLVNSVSRDSSVVQTVFDANFKMPVRIGSTGIDALLQGGSYPEAVSISKQAVVHPGDIVYAAAPGIPYALPIGEVATVYMSSDNLFEQATIKFPYDINSIEAVTVER